ncbi:restriction endonuclease subunit S [Pseudidiomarina gelatinasegens]|uniref:restriction endonuclease subunit S n=1 Tax=Pseudidiomarina gelatinasegens TaxID=2487740 RepID=UPI0030EB3EF8|tara:strand:- start:1519 stop:2745 length:1227 start_codon:yes stop_codon:yes gene_type:complete
MGWPVKPLGELCEFRNGLWKGKKPPFQEVTVIRNTNFTKGCELDLQDVAVLDVELKQYQSRKLEFGDLILEKSGGGPNQPVGRIVKFEVPDGDYSFSNFTSIVRVKDPSILDYSFLHKFLFYLYEIGATEPLQRQSTGIRNLQLKEYKEIMIPIPALEEQKRIVAMLDEAFADIDKARELTEQNLKNARELFESYLAKIFDESKKDSNQYKLEDISGGVFTGPFGSLLHKSDYVTGGIPIVNPAHITEQGINIDDRKTIKIEKASELRAYTMREGDIVISRRGEMGRCAVVGENESGYICGTGSFVIRASKRFHSDYLVSYLRHSRTRRQLEKIAGGAVMPNLSNKQLSALKLHLPTIDEQVRLANQIRNVCNQIEKVSTIYESKIDSLNSLRTSLLKKVFTSLNAII